MRTNIVLNDDLLAEAGKYSHARSKRELVEEALKTFIQTKSAEHKSATYKERFKDLEKKLSGVKLRESSIQILRDMRERS